MKKYFLFCFLFIFLISPIKAQAFSCEESYEVESIEESICAAYKKWKKNEVSHDYFFNELPKSLSFDHKYDSIKIFIYEQTDFSKVSPERAYANLFNLQFILSDSKFPYYNKEKAENLTFLSYLNKVKIYYNEKDFKKCYEPIKMYFTEDDILEIDKIIQTKLNLLCSSFTLDFFNLARSFHKKTPEIDWNDLIALELYQIAYIRSSFGKKHNKEKEILKKSYSALKELKPYFLDDYITVNLNNQNDSIRIPFLESVVHSFLQYFDNIPAHE